MVEQCYAQICEINVFNIILFYNINKKYGGNL